MKKRIVLALSLFIPLLAGTAQTTSPRSVIAFTHVTVIDTTGAPAKPDMTVIIMNGRINALGKTGRTRLPADAREINATGKFMIPGLWDMHAHPSGEGTLALFIANGVTGVRVMM